MSLSLREVRSRPLVAVVLVLAVVLVALATYAELGYALSVWQQDGGRDIRAYLGAAERLRDGGTLYLPGAANDTELYRYAPWFAFLWIPFVDLPRDVVLTGWIVILVVASVASVLPLLGSGVAGLPAAALLLAFQLEGTAYGNVQPLLVAVLVHGLARRTAPLWIAMAASLKAVPIVLVVVLLGRRQYQAALVATGLTVLLVAPMLLFDLSGYSTETGAAQMSLMEYSPFAFLAVALAATFVALRAAASPSGWLAGAVAVTLWLPRMLAYEISFVLLGTAELGQRRAAGSAASRNVRS